MTEPRPRVPTEPLRHGACDSNEDHGVLTPAQLDSTSEFVQKMIKAYGYDEGEPPAAS